MQVELLCSDLVERSRTRLLYAISESDKAAAATDLDDVSKLSQEWAELCAAAEAVDLQLDRIKRSFALTTHQQVCHFGCHQQSV